MVNPLHHIPLVGPLYRELSGDTISLGSRLIGGTVVGGGLGFVGALGQHIFERYDGTEKLKSMVGLAPNQREKTAMQASGNGKQQTDQDFATLASSGNTIATQGVASPPGDTKGTELENNAVPATHNETILEGALALSAFLAQNHTKQKKAPRLPEEKNPTETDDYPPNSQQNAQQQRQNPLLDMIGEKQANDDPSAIYGTLARKAISQIIDTDTTKTEVTPQSNQMQKTDIKSNEALPKKLRHLLADSPAMAGNHHAASSHLHGKKAVQPFTAEFAAKLSRRAQINPNFTAPFPSNPPQFKGGPCHCLSRKIPLIQANQHPRPLQKSQR